MDSRCDRCAHYRPQRSLVECLSLGNSLELAPINQSIMQTEQSLLAKEEGFKMELLKANRQQWPFKPQVQAYCALHEDQNAYFVPEIKNPTGRCGDFKEDRHGVSLPCDTCAHHQPAFGHARNHQDLMDVISPSNFHSSMRIDDHSATPPCSITQDLQTVMQVSQKGQSLEMLMALNNGGVLTQPPQYYAHCRKYSAPRKYAICRMQNPHGRCLGHSMAAVRPSGTETLGHSEPSHTEPAPRPGVEGGASPRPRSTFFRDLARHLVQDIDDE